MNVSIHNGWYQVAYERDLKEALNAASLGDRRIALCRQQDGITAIDAYCPHRGAHLCHGGSLGEDYVVCPFHGFKIGLRRPIGGFQAEAYETMMVGGLVFVKIPGGADCGLRAELLALDATHFIVPGFEMLINAPASLVIENAFDATHFHPVHRVMKPPCFPAGAEPTALTRWRAVSNCLPPRGRRRQVQAARRCPSPPPLSVRPSYCRNWAVPNHMPC
ncbi:MAG: hypothetical protein EOP84_19170 [Verrucomicrobiaceae bacterium]|nr:MAG: hypothetical protein EOP84_19170 [Verrucomicrobiaceae bacterium]